MREYCSICKRPIEPATSVFKTPRLIKRRLLWEQACGRTLKRNQLICQRHFSPEQYCQRAKLKRLRPNAVPCREMRSVSTDFHVNGRREALPEPVKEREPTLAEVIAEPFELINEENFDGAPTAMDVGTDVASEIDSGEEEKVDEEEEEVTTVPAEYFKTSRHFCGLIEVTKDYKTYTMNCFYCKEIFSIWSWTKFVKHIQENHRQQEQRTDECDEDNVDEMLYTTQKERTQQGIFQVQPQIRAAETTIKNVAIELEVVQEEMSYQNADKVDDTQNNGQVVQKKPQKKTIKKIHKKVDKQKGEVEKTEEDLQLSAGIFCQELPTIVKRNDCSASDYDDEEDVGKEVNHRPRDAEQLYLRDSPAIVNDFLALWKTYPILCHNRPSRYDTAYDRVVAELTAKLNSKWQLSKTKRGMHQSLYRIRKWFYDFKRCTPPAHNKTQVATYYDKCTEFLPDRRALPLSCSKCIHYFADEQQLQAHYAQRHETFCTICRKHYATPTKYRRHAIVHEPPEFTCPTCGKKYHREAGLQEHMRAHRNERNFVCDKCGKGFVRSKTLRDHTIQVHLDNPAHTCRICGDKFNTWNAIISHKRRQHLVLEGTIEDLEKQSRELKSRKSNKINSNKYNYVFDAATGMNRIACDVCGNTYRFTGTMVRHKVIAHGYISDSSGNKTALKACNEAANEDANVRREAVETIEDDNDDEEEELFELEIIKYDAEETDFESIE